MMVHDWECGQRCYKEVDTDGDWKSSGDMMFAIGVFCIILNVLSMFFQCCNLTPDASRKKALAGCCLMDGCCMILLIGLGMYYLGTYDIRTNDAPDSNGIVTTYAPGSSYMAAIAACILMMIAVTSGVIAKPPPLDEGMQATVELEEGNPATTLQMQQATKAFAKSY